MRWPRRVRPLRGQAVRNYQARRIFMRDQMNLGDGVLFCHSGCADPGIRGPGRGGEPSLPDPTQFDPSSAYYDAKSASNRRAGCWSSSRVAQDAAADSARAAAAHQALADMRVLQKGNRLSITPFTAGECA